MIRLLSLCYLLLSMTVSTAWGQEIEVGQELKDFEIKNITRYKRSSGNFKSEFGNKPTILEFYNVYCKPCIEGMPKLQAMKNELNNAINFVMVTRESSEETEKFFNANKYVKDVKLPVITNDSILAAFFPHLEIPHYVWLDTSLVVRAITASEYVTKENVKAFVEGKSLRLPIKKDNMNAAEINGEIPLMITDEKYNLGNQRISYSYLSGYNKAYQQVSLSPRRSKINQDGFRKLQLRNADIYTLFQQAYSLNGTYGMLKYQLIKNFKDSGKFEPNLQKRTNFYCYDLLLKDTSEINAHNWMIQDLDRSFKLKSHFEVRSMPCLVLKRKGNKMLKESPGISEYYDEEAEVILEHHTLFQVAKRIADLSQLQVFDETGYGKKSVDISIPKDWTNLKVVNKALAKYGVEVLEEKRDLKVIVLEDAI